MEVTPGTSPRPDAPLRPRPPGPRAPRPRAPRQLLARDERRAQVLRAAASAFVHEGYAATSIDDVAAAAGITRVIVYRHFAGKEDLYRSILDEVLAELALAFEAANQARGDGPDAPAPSLVALLAGARAHPDAFRLLTVHAAREAEFRAYAELTRGAMERAARTLLDPLRVDAVVDAWLGALLVDTGVAAVLRWLDHGDPSRDDEFLRRATAALRDMVHAATAAAPAPSPEPVPASPPGTSSAATSGT